ncbi:MAG: hypothetical protein R3321_11625 [Nitrososphaeraceae archaeon]|nr:hypothetical protein [Nitrososphaeraceae archaeon]
MNKRQLLERKLTYQGFIDIGLFWLPDQNEFVTWVINKQYENKSSDFGCCNGHYFFDYESAKKDYEERS